MNQPRPRLYLSAPHLGDLEQRYVAEAFASNWVAPLGPHVDAFEREICALTGCGHAAALSSGTAALHLALILAGVGPGDEVWCATLTFSASANPIRYLGATPVFIDCEPSSWNLDPALLAEALDDAARRGRLPKAVIAVDLYGQCADYQAIATACARHGVKLIEDAAEALGARYRGRSAGAFGWCGVFSFNGNKIITTSGGGMLVSDDERAIVHARHLATQARDPAPWYQHSEVGYNYRLSNVLAGIGRGQLAVLEARVQARRAVNQRYRELLGGLPGVSFMPATDSADGTTRSTRWLTVIQVDPAAAGASAEDLRLTLAEDNVEARPVWKPMHLQPVFAGCRAIGGAVAERLFAHGLCLPSGSAMGGDDLERVVRLVRARMRA
jgi:pyridoxal phosphate-dependent aminotransferase EpsN